MKGNRGAKSKKRQRERVKEELQKGRGKKIEIDKGRETGTEVKNLCHSR